MVSIIIPIFNSPKHTLTGIFSLFEVAEQQTLTVEIVVVDDGSFEEGNLRREAVPDERVRSVFSWNQSWAQCRS